MNLREITRNTITDIAGIPAMNTVNLSPIDALKVERDYVQRFLRSMADRCGELADNPSLRKTVFVSSVSVGQMIYDYGVQELLSAYDEAIEHAEAQADEPYFAEAAE